MIFTIHASKADQNITTVRIGPAATADKVRELEKMGWELMQRAVDLRRQLLSSCC